MSDMPAKSKLKKNSKIRNIKELKTKSKTAKTSNIETLIIHEQKREDRNGFPDPISAQCFKCQKQL